MENIYNVKLIKLLGHWLDYGRWGELGYNCWNGVLLMETEMECCAQEEELALDKSMDSSHRVTGEKFGTEAGM